jgi:kanamycin kinase/aminoglycoside 3'-phosphotransferase-2
VCEHRRVSLSAPDVVARSLLGRVPDHIEPIIVWDHRATFRCEIGAEVFLCKIDDDLVEHAREVEGHTRAAAAGIPVPELVAVEAGALAMRWVSGVALSGQSSDEAWRETGRMLRRVHEIGRPGHFGACFPVRATWAESVGAEVDEELAKCVRDHGLAVEQARRVRNAIDAGAALADADLAFCHGDLQPDHVLLDPETDRVVSVIDWSDFGAADAAWDLAVLTLDDDDRLPVFSEGYGAAPDHVHLYRLVRWVGEVRWLSAHDLVDAADHSRRQLANWRPG